MITVLAEEVPLLCAVRVPLLHFFGVFLGGIFEPTEVGADDVVILVRLLPVKLDTRLLSFPVLIATAMQ